MTFSGINLLLVLPALAGAAFSADPVDLFKRHRYEEAASIWEKDANKSPLDEKGLRALKGLSLAYRQLGGLYAELQDFSVALQEEYYEGVLADASSPLAQYYLGQVQLLQAQWAPAVSTFEKAKKLGGAKVPDVNEVFLGFAKARQKNLPTPPSSAKSNAAQWEGWDLGQALPSALPSGFMAETPRSRRCRLSILARVPSPEIDSLRALLLAVLRDCDQPEVSQDPGKNSQIDFYDPFLLETLSRAYFALSKGLQQRLLQEEKKFPDLAQKFVTRRGLAEVSLLLGQYPEALEYLGASDVDADDKLLRAKILGKQGKVSEAKALLDGVTQNSKNPATLRDVAECYYFLKTDLEKGTQLATQALRDRNTSPFYRTRAQLLLANGEAETALQEYAKGYKIEFRNRIDQIDPEYMSDYSYAIFLTSKMRYDEIVETLYHLQKEFPACRQMHYAMQGISAALPRGYEPQHIIRKGG